MPSRQQTRHPLCNCGRHSHSPKFAACWECRKASRPRCGECGGPQSRRRDGRTWFMHLRGCSLSQSRGGATVVQHRSRRSGRADTEVCIARDPERIARVARVAAAQERHESDLQKVE